MIKCEKGKNDLQWMLQTTMETFCDMVNVHVFNIGVICIHGEELLRQLAPPKLVSEQDEIYGVKTIDWENPSCKYLCFNW